MSALTFYRQARYDGGVRTGVEVDGETAFGRFDPGPGDPDPALLWYVDVRCDGGSLPAEPDQARNWFLSNAGLIKDELRAVARELESGLDSDAWPLMRPVSHAPKGVEITIACSAIRRMAGRDIAAKLTDLADHWTEYLQGLRAAEPAGY